MKYLKFSCVFLLLLLSFQMVTFAESNAETELLVRLGIIESGLAEKESVSRAEFAHITVNFMNMEAAAARDVYADVSRNHTWAISY